MLKHFYICKKDGTTRIVGYHVPDASDPPEVANMHARFPPGPTMDPQVDQATELVFDTQPTDVQLAAAFAAVDAALGR